MLLLILGAALQQLDAAQLLQAVLIIIMYLSAGVFKTLLNAVPFVVKCRKLSDKPRTEPCLITLLTVIRML